jgi:hypothetical protein
MMSDSKSIQSHLKSSWLDFLRLSGTTRIAAYSGVVFLLSWSLGCGGAGPTAPSATGTDHVSMSGMVYTAASRTQVGSAQLEIVTGQDAGRTTLTDPTGHYRFDGLAPGTLTLRASAAGFAPATQTVILAASQVADISLAPASAPAASFMGRVLDVLTGAPLAGITVNTNGTASASTDGSGAFTLTGTASALNLDFTGPGVVARHTALPMTAGNALVSLIPANFDLFAFDQMFRAPQLLRWTTAPPLAIERAALRFTTVDGSSYDALGDTMSDADTNSLIDDLTWALPQMTGGNFPAFASVTRQTAGAGTTVNVYNAGVISVARYRGLEAATGYWGYGRAMWRGDGTVIGGAIMLDADFDKSGSRYRRSLHAHELGHALGYNHVTARPSVMNAAAELEPNAFDRDASRIAFQRAPGNRSPDNDPQVYQASTLAMAGGVWGQSIH